MKKNKLPVLTFDSSVPVKNIESPISKRKFNQFEKKFRPFIEKREAIYSRIPGGDTWPSFEPDREKVLEYYLTVEALSLKPRSTYLDIASCLSLFPNYVAERIGATVYRQDLLYPEGIRSVEFPRISSIKPGRTTVNILSIGSDACSLPLTSSSVDSIALHCSFEHFEGDSDGRFTKEALRLLRPGGRMLIIPFYCGNTYEEVHKEGFADGCQFHRYYNPSKFFERVLSVIDSKYSLEMRYYRNSRKIDESFYCDYSLAIVKG